MRVFFPSVIFSTTVLLLLGGISHASEENVNATGLSESNQQLPGNAPPDADKRRSAQYAKETMLRGESSGTGNVTLEELKALMEMGIDELVVRDEEIADGVIANASDDTEGSNGVDYSKDGASSHKQEVNHQPKSASAVVANAAKIQQQGEEEYYEEDEFDESVYEQELAKFLADKNFVDETRDLDEEDMDGGLNNGTEATSRRHLRYLHSKKIELPSIYIHGNDKHNEDNKNNNETRRLQNLSTSIIGTFAPLSCNLPSLPTTSQCHKTPTGLFSTLVNAANGAPITIPCGTCYKYDLPWGRTFELGGLDIIGKLYIPPNWKTVIKTPYIFVQGELEIINNRLITPDNLSTRIILTGDSDVWFRPADSNQGVEGTPFNAGKKPLLVAGGKLNIRGWDRDDTSSTLSDGASYTTWSPILSKTADGTFALRDDETGISSRWGPMSEIHITSSTLSSLDGHDAVLSTISPNADGITASITLQTPVDTTTTPITSEEESPGRGAEVTLLSRNIVIEGEFLSRDTYPAQSGGYLQILHTPGISQIIEGVDFQNMGQELGKNRFPIQFLYNGDVLGSSVARNTIRNSNHRCIVVEGTFNVTVASNVAYETAGHCYFFGHESVDNIVRGNIGVRTNDVIGSGSQLDGHSDHSRATFFMWSPINEYIGNVAAGGDGRGFYMYNNAKTLGEDLVSTNNGNLRRVAMKTFKDNKSHSNVWQGFVFYNFEQYYTFGDDINIPLFENTMAYRNQQHGILGNNLHGAMFRGGILADNQWGMRIPRSDGIKIEDFQIMGYTDVVGDVTASNDKIKLCARSSWNLQGIIMMNTRWMYGEHVLGYGMRMKNVTFSDFDKNTGSCASSWPIAMDSYKYYDTHFDYLSSWENVRVVDSRGYVLDGCGAMQTYGFYDVVINDLYGSLDRTGLSTGPSALVSNTPALTKLLGNKCSAHTDSCMAYCSGVCMQSFYYNVEQFRSETWKLVITDANGESTEISGSIEAVDDYSFSDAFRYTKFPVALPAGTYTARFVDELGDLVWPTFVEEVWEEPPACAGSAKPEDIKFVKPEISDDCDDLFRLEDTGTTNPWIHTDTGVEVAIGMGISGTDAIRTSNRRYSWTGFGQNIDTRCIDLRPNQYYEFAALIKLTDTSGNPALDTVIDPNVQWDLNKSPIMTLSAREYRDAASLIYF